MTEPGDPSTHDAGAPSFRLGYVPGVTPGKWARTWAQRRPNDRLDLVATTTHDAVDLIRSEAVDAGVVRLPIDRTGLHAIPLYTETTVVVVPKDHVLTAVDEAELDDLADEIVLRPQDDTVLRAAGRAAVHDPATTADAVELVAAGVGLLVVPQSLARLHHRRDLTYRPLAGAPGSGVVLAWPDAGNTELMEEFIGVVRGRTAHSSRTPRPERAPAPAAPSRTAPSRTPKGGSRRGRRRR